MKNTKMQNIVSIENVSFSYPGMELLDKLTVEVKEGDFVAIIGPNGAGKTTLMKLILGFLEPAEGKIKLFGKNLKDFDEWVKVGYVPQRLSIDKLFPGTVEEILSLNKVEAEKTPETLEIKKVMKKKFTELSGGQQQRVLIALALKSDPKLLILDEPTVGVDIKTQREFYDMLKHLNKKHNVTILFITHEVGMIASCCKTVLCINHNLHFQTAASDIDTALKRVYGDSFMLHHHLDENEKTNNETHNEIPSKKKHEKEAAKNA